LENIEGLLTYRKNIKEVEEYLFQLILTLGFALRKI